mgnify:CR=1 FL=1
MTIADKKAHAAIAGYLQKTPYPLLSEEGKHLPYTERCAWTTLWIVDPLDGTKEFIKRNGEFTVNIALVRNSVPVMGVIYLPVKRELYFAEETLGAYKLSDFTARSGASLEELIAKAVNKPIKDNNDKYIIIESEGKADVYPRVAPSMEWDTAAGHAIARAVGRDVYQAGKEEPLQYNKEDLLNPWFIVEPRRN